MKIFSFQRLNLFLSFLLFAGISEASPTLPKGFVNPVVLEFDNLRELSLSPDGTLLAIFERDAQERYYVHVFSMKDKTKIGKLSAPELKNSQRYSDFYFDEAGRHIYVNIRKKKSGKIDGGLKVGKNAGSSEIIKVKDLPRSKYRSLDLPDRYAGDLSRGEWYTDKEVSRIVAVDRNRNTEDKIAIADFSKEALIAARTSSLEEAVQLAKDFLEYQAEIASVASQRIQDFAGVTTYREAFPEDFSNKGDAYLSALLERVSRQDIESFIPLYQDSDLKKKAKIRLFELSEDFNAASKVLKKYPEIKTEAQEKALLLIKSLNDLEFFQDWYPGVKLTKERLLAVAYRQRRFKDLFNLIESYPQLKAEMQEPLLNMVSTIDQAQSFSKLYPGESKKLNEAIEQVGEKGKFNMPANFFNEESHWINEVIRTSDGHYLLTADFQERLYPNTKPKVRGGIVKLDYQGRPVWKTKFLTKSNKFPLGDRKRDERTDCMEIDDVYECANGDLIACGIVEHRRVGEYVRVLFLARLTRSGEILWEKRFDDIAISRYGLRKPGSYSAGTIRIKLSIAETQMGEIVVSGFSPQYDEMMRDVGFQVFRFSKDGNLINRWEDEYIWSSYANAALLEKEDGSMEFVYCYRNVSSGSMMRVLQIKSGATEPRKKFEVEIGREGSKARLDQVIMDEKGNYWGVGSQEVANGRYKHRDLLVVKVDPSGEVVIRKVYDSKGKNDQLQAICLGRNNDLVVAGFSQLEPNYTDRSLFFGLLDRQGNFRDTRYFERRDDKEGQLLGGASKVIPAIWGGYLLAGDYFVNQNSPQQTGMLSLDESGVAENYLKLFKEKAFKNIDQVVSFVKEYPEYKKEAEPLAGALAQNYEDFEKYISTFKSGKYYAEINKYYKDYQYIDQHISLLDYNIWAAEGDRNWWDDFVESNRNMALGGDRYNVFISGILQNKGDRKMRIRIQNLLRTVSTSSSGFGIFRSYSVKENEYERNYFIDLEPGDVQSFAVVFRNQKGDSGYKLGYFSSYSSNRLDENPFEIIFHPYYEAIDAEVKKDQQFVYEAAVIGNLRVTKSGNDRMKEWVDGVLGRIGLESPNSTRLSIYLEVPDYQGSASIQGEDQVVKLEKGIDCMRADFFLPPGKKYTVEIPGKGNYTVLVKDRLTHLIIDKDGTTRVVYDQ